ncbi:LEM domain-containing protein 1 isoform X2 [Anabas testudineus]|uniref:LEM domain-containing protein 1 isoform X2 n=1 Tax=Anabas testudineus TaxID=64144 RepID=UPI000E45FA9C|nr:LEM domain-containing protein 1 isoform X2 [Anabas testudineus]
MPYSFQRGTQEREKEEENREVPDPSGLTDEDLKAALLRHGVKAGPIVASTRALYERKLKKLLQSDGHGQLNGAEKGVLYSDSEEEEETGEEDDAESDSEGEKQPVEQSDQAQQESSQVKVNHPVKNGHFAYPQCFLPSSRLRARASRNRELKWNSRNALKSSDRSQSYCSKIPVGISGASSVDQRSGLGSGVPSGSQTVKASGCSSAFSITQMVEELETRSSLSAPADTEKELNGSNVQEDWSRSDRLDMPAVDAYTMKNQSLYFTPKASPYKLRMKEPDKDAFKDLFPDIKATPTGIYASRRRPIKGAAGRPVQYAYPDTPASPMTLERREVERRLVPIHVQLLVFLILACLLYFIYVCVEDGTLNPFVALLDSLHQGSGSEDGLLLQAKTQDTPALYGQE